MNEIFVARNALAATLTSSAVAKSRDHDRNLAVLGGGQVEDALVRGVQHRRRPLALDAEHHPVGAQHILDRVPLLQELRAPRHLDAQLGVRVLGDQLLHPLGRADRHGRLADDQRPTSQPRRQIRHRRLDVRRSAAIPSARCGVPTQMKWMSANSATSSYEVVNRSRPPARFLRSNSSSPGSWNGT